MCQFKPGDAVTPADVSCSHYSERMKQLLGKTLLVLSVGDGKNGDEFVWAGVPGEEYWYWYPNDLRLVSAWSPEPLQPDPTDPAPAAAKKPLRRGDLVVLNGEIGVVHDLEPDGENGYWVAALTGDGSCVWRCAEDLTRIGSIRKKIKRIKKEMEGAK